MKKEIPATATEKIVVKNLGEATVQILGKFRKNQAELYGDLDFHNEKHPEFVRQYALEFAKIIMRIDPELVTKKTLADIVSSAASHDSVLNAAREAMLIRFRGFFAADLEGETKEKQRELMSRQGIEKGNELLSWEKLEEELDRYIHEEGNSVFNEKAIQEMRLAIAATFPEFNFTATIPDEAFAKYFSGEFGEELRRYKTGIKVWQPHLEPGSPITALAVAEADLRGEASSKNFGDYRRGGNAEFRELSVGLRKTIDGGVENIPQEDRAKISGAILGWIKSQVTFAMWQKVLFWEAIDANKAINSSSKAEEIKKALAERYNREFDKNIVASKKRYEVLEKTFGTVEDAEQRKVNLASISDENFRLLLKAVGYSI